jgi:type III pantothenate kinase
MSNVPPVDALLAIDVGNTRIGLAIYDGDGIHHSVRVPAAEPRTWQPAIDELWAATLGARRRAVVIGSVAPRVARQIADLAEEVCAVEPVFVRADLPLPMPLEIANADEVGVDRVCAAAAAFDRIQGACAVASFGTAITIDCISSEGRFLGGAILPGFELSCAALHEHTAQLPQVTPRAPVSPFGKDTEQAIVGGVAYGAVGALREIVERFADELGEWPHLVITGGNAPLVHGLANFVDSVVPDLVLMGVALAYRKAAGQP